ncbi:hypothetical protein [Paenibacillus antarcticus]|uniref:Uncharacterized protein n=1 Tax=Paenibacillus antarcticus TaxID=253703 RepID=A0A168R0Z4_9BACL|nr:hypothetical protein [Paenibacillus antarcticus]OAB48452.1 hypothetical protein PBAT_02135 [Paenibacillus antarcticus]
MPQKSGMFDSTIDDPREYAAREFAEYFARMLTNGVFNGGQYLQVTATGTNSYVSISPGAAWIKGYAYSVYDEAIALPVTPATTLDRIDRIVLRLDTSTPVRSIKAIVLQGVPNANPVPPALVRSGDIYDLSLAQVRVVANSIIVTQAKITDERMNSAVCGLVNSLIQVDTTTFQQQWDLFMASLESQGFVTATAFNAHKADNAKHIPHLGTTTNAGNVYSITTAEVIATNQKFTTKINAASTGAATLKVSSIASGAAKSIQKVGGTSATLKIGVYTLFWDGTSFQLLGEGGEYGTASANDVRKEKTLGTDSGVVQGGLDLSALIPSNIRNGVTIDGVAGALLSGIEKPLILMLPGSSTVGSLHPAFGTIDFTPIVQSVGSVGNSYFTKAAYVRLIAQGVGFSSFATDVSINLTNVDVISVRAAAYRTAGDAGARVWFGATIGKDDRNTSYTAITTTSTPTVTEEYRTYQFNVSALSGMFYIKAEAVCGNVNSNTYVDVAEIILYQNNK